MTSVRKLLARYDIHPRKRLGQSFLEDMNIIRRIVALAEPAENETVVEIGAGLGSMTEELAKKAGRVIALEVDPRLVAVLQERFIGQDRVEVLQTDVLKYDFSSACPGGRIKVVGNIPYHISSPILFRLLDFRRSISSMILMFQKELADRIMASPGTKDYGIPSVIVARYTRGHMRIDGTRRPAFILFPTWFRPFSGLRFDRNPISRMRRCLQKSSGRPSPGEEKPSGTTSAISVFRTKWSTGCSPEAASTEPEGRRPCRSRNSPC